MSHSELAGFPVVIRSPVQWGDMDAYGHVNNTIFFRYFESARIAYLEQCGFLASYLEHRIGAILHSTDCRFRRALTYPDEVLVGARALEVGNDRFTMGYAIVSVNQDAVAATGTGVVVSYDYQRLEKTPLPGRVRAGITEVERRT